MTSSPSRLTGASSCCGSALLKLRAQDLLIRLQLKKLSDLQTAKDEMLCLMVHDLRSPLSGIIAHLSLLIDHPPAARCARTPTPRCAART